PYRFVGHDREHTRAGRGGAQRLQRPHLPLAEALAAELGLAAQRLLRDERVGPGGAGVDLVVDQVQQLEDLHVPHRHLFLEGLAAAAVEQRHLAGGLLAGATALVDVHVDRAPVRVLPAHERVVDVLDGGDVEHGRGDVTAAEHGITSDDVTVSGRYAGTI